jgi:hypothetical protein
VIELSNGCCTWSRSTRCIVPDVCGRVELRQTLFGIASNSKLFTSIAAGLALSRANLTWETPVHSVVPAFRLVDPEAERGTTFIELLSRQIGVPRHDLSYRQAIGDHRLSPSTKLDPSGRYGLGAWSCGSFGTSRADSMPLAHYCFRFRFTGPMTTKPILQVYQRPSCR